MNCIKNNEALKTHLKNCITLNIFEHIIIYGENNSGKSFIIDCFLKDYFKDTPKNGYIFNFDIIEDRGIKKIRKELKDFCLRKPLKENVLKFVIIPKTEFLNHDSLCALRRIIELYSCNVRFIFSCNNLNSIIPAIISRCVVFRTEKVFSYKKEILQSYQEDFYMFEYGITKEEYDCVVAITENPNSHCNSRISNDILFTILSQILKEKKEFNRLIALSKLLYIHYRLPEQDKFVMINILNILKLIKN